MPDRHAATARRAACALALMGALSPCVASEQAPLAHFYANLYPEWKALRYANPSPKGALVGTMGTQRNDSTVLSADVAGRDPVDEPEWSNSYIGLRGSLRAAGLNWGYDLQGTIDLNDSALDNLRFRDAFVYVESGQWGRIAVGRMDSQYKEVGDALRMLGVSSGNFVSTSGVLSGVGWRARGATSFNNRTSRMLSWVSPELRGFTAGLSHAVDPVPTLAGTRSRLSAASLQWREGPWHAAVALETHRDWLPLSLAAPGTTPVATSIVNSASTTRSHDKGLRFTLAWKARPLSLAADVSRLSYNESDSVGVGGKFRHYANLTWQVSAEYQLSHLLGAAGNGWRVAGNHARGSAGSCSLSGGVACSTQGLGGHQTSWGAMYAFNPQWSVFALASRFENNAGARYGSAPQGGTTSAKAVGLRWVLR